MDNPENVVDMPFLPWLDVQSSNPVETIGITLFFLIVGVTLYYIFKKKKENHETPHLNLSKSERLEGYTYLDDKVEISDIHSTHNLPKGVRVTLQSEGENTQYDATVINITELNFTVFINNDPEHNYDPQRGMNTVFLADINNSRWSFTTKFITTYDEGVYGYVFEHTNEIFISRKRKEARITKDVPALFSVIPRNVVLGPIPILDLIGNAQGNIPATIRDISASGCAVNTRSPLNFTSGDLAVVSFLLPDTPQEQTVFAAVNKVQKVASENGGGCILNMEFIKLSTSTDEAIKLLVNSHIEEEIIN